MLIVPLVVIGEPVIFKLSPLSVIATLVTVPVAPDALCQIFTKKNILKKIHMQVYRGGILIKRGIIKILEHYEYLN